MSPFEIFRRNLKPLMVFLTALALFAFVVLPAMDSYMRRGGGPGASDAELASFDGKPLRRSRVDYLTRNHQSTVRFLRELAEETIRRGGAPQTPGFAYDSQNRRIQSIGIDERPSELGTVRTMQFANEAKKAGFELDDTAIQSWLYSFTGEGKVSEGEMLAMLMESTRNQMGKFHLYEQLRGQLLAELYQRGNLSGLSVNGQIPVVTPVEQWENFLKLNRQATATTYGVLVSDYLDQTNAEPTASAIGETYEAGKDRYPNEQSADPAFRRRETASFEYVLADLRSFVDREAKEFSDEKLRAEYEQRLAGGAFQMPASTEDVLGFGDEDDAGADAEMDADSSSDETDSDAEKAEVAETDESDDDSEPEPKDNQASEESTDDETGSDSDANEEDQSNVLRSPAVQLVVFQADGEDVEADDVKKSDKPRGNKDEKKPEADGKKKPDQADASKTDETKKNAKPKKKKKPEPAVDQDADKKDTDKKDDADKKDTDKKESSAEGGNDDGKMKADSEADKKADKEEDKEEVKEEEPKVESFEDVRQQIAAELAAPEARRKMDEAINDIDSKMRRYFNLKAIHESNLKIDRPSEAPTKPDLKALAAKYGMQYEAIGPHDIVSLRNEPIAQSSELSNELGQPGPPFTAMMFGVSNNQTYIPKQQLHFPLRTSDLTTGKSYVSWKTEETEAYTPTLDEAREEVILAIRTEEARELARVEAVRLADEANEGKDLASLIPEDKKVDLKEGLGPFSWMNSYGFGGAFLGNVPELDSVGEEFMSETFRTKEGEYAVAANLPERVVYVVQPTGFQPSTEELRRRFKQPRERMMALLLGTEDVQSVMRGFYESIDERTGFNFVVPEQE